MTARCARHIRPLTSVALLTLLAGCATAPVEIHRADLSSPDAASRAPDPDAPRVWIANIEDGRSDTTLGALAGRSFSSAELPAWIDGELAALASPGFAVMTGPAPGARASLILRPRLLKAYVDSVNVTKTAVIVLGVDIVALDGTTTARLYRGQHASLNWATSGSEVAGALQDAAASCLEQLRVDLEVRLHPGRPPPPRAAPVEADDT